MNSINFYPWQLETARRLGRLRERHPHALLLQGRRGIGKLDFAMAYARYLLCEEPQPEVSACAGCVSCNWFAQGNHPDFRLLEPEEAAAEEEGDAAGRGAKKSTQITVDQVRLLGDFLPVSSHRAGLRIALLHPAEALNAASANALLKMLEEPPRGVVFLLVTHQPQRLLPTIRSRCSRMDMPVPPREIAAAWLRQQGVANADERLAYCGGSPLQALAADEGGEGGGTAVHALLAQGGGMDPHAAAASCARNGLPATIEALQKWLYDVLALRLGAGVRYHPGRIASLQALAERVDLEQLLDFQHTLIEACRTAQHPLNQELQIESLMLQYLQLYPRQARP